MNDEDATGAQSRRSAAGGALVRAFSPRRNLRAIFVPKEAFHATTNRLRPLDGLRALSILWVVAFHSAWYSFMVLPLPAYGQLLSAKWMLPIWRGDFGVDVFFVLSGFLIGGLLIDERAKTGNIALGRFYLRRLLRLWPALIVATFVFWRVFGAPKAWWASVLYVSNFLPVLDVSMGWLWSLAIEEQFYVVCPWLVLALMRLSGRTRAFVLAALVVVVCIVSGAVTMHGGFHALDSEIVYTRPPLPWARAFDALYSKPWMRAGPLLLGVASAFVFRTDSLRSALTRTRGRTFLLAAVGLGLAALATHWPLFEHAPRWLEVFYLATYRSVFGGGVALLLLAAIGEASSGTLLSAFFGSRALYPFAQLAYSAYLLNPIVTMSLHAVLADFARRTGLPPMVVFVPCDAAATFAAAVVLHVTVERPFMDLRSMLPQR